MRLLLQPLFENVSRSGGVLVVAAFLPFGILIVFHFGSLSAVPHVSGTGVLVHVLAPYMAPSPKGLVKSPMVKITIQDDGSCRPCLGCY